MANGNNKPIPRPLPKKIQFAKPVDVNPIDTQRAEEELNYRGQWIRNRSTGRFGNP